MYHVVTRGVDRRAVYRGDDDRAWFLHYLERAVRRYRWRCYAYCLMTNHYHLVVGTPEPTISDGMKLLNGRYSLAFNREHGREGHLWEKRFSDELILREPHLLEACRYAELNPVRAGVCGHPRQWRWSSFRATVGDAPRPPFLASSWILDQFAADRARARTLYREFVEAGIGLPGSHDRPSWRAAA